jgi:hypothetical protein
MPEHTYVDFDLLIEPAEGRTYRARVLNSPVGETRPVPVTMPFSDLELENFLLKVGRPRRQDTRGEASPEAAAVREFGGRLFDAVFRDQLRTALAASIDQVEGQQDTGLRVRLRLSDCPELTELPWEYLYDSDARRFLALSQWTPVVRYLEMPSPIRPLRVTPPLRILMMAASPTDFPSLDVVAEWTKVREALEGLQQAGRVQLDRVPTGTLADLRAALRGADYHVFHFIGHGRYDSTTQDGVLALEGPQGRAQLVSGADMGALLHDERSLRLALLNSCEGARGGLDDPYAGTAQSLVYQGIPAVVAMQFEITDAAAITFARSLYAAVADGYPLDAAMAEARNAVREQPNAVEWATPVLYLRAADGRIFDVPADAPQPPPPQPPPQPLPPPPPEPPAPEPGRPLGNEPHRGPVERPTSPRRRALLVASAATGAVAAGVAGWVVLSGGSDGGGSSSSSSSSASPTSTAQDLGLPRGDPLPDSALVVPLTVDGNTDLYVVDTAAADHADPLVEAPAEDVAPLISPGRRSVVYAHKVGGDAGYELRVVATDGSGDRALFPRSVEGCASPTRPGWNEKEPTQLAVACYPYFGAPRAQLRVTTLEGETVRSLDAGVARVDDVSFSPDGSRIVYWGRDDPQGDGGQLYSVPADGSGPAQQLTEVAGNADAVYSPGGDEIAFRRQIGDEARIYVMAADGSGERALTNEGWFDQDPTWSPDGNWIAFKSNRTGARSGDQFWVMDRNGAGLRQLGYPVDGQALNAPAWGHR